MLVLAACVALFGGLALRRLSIDAVADVTNVQVSIITSAPGLSPAEGRAVPDLSHRDGDERPARRDRDPQRQSHVGLGGHRDLR